MSVVQTTITMQDFMRATLSRMLRWRPLCKAWAFWTIALGGYLALSHRIHTQEDWLILVVAAAGGGIGSVIASIVIAFLGASTRIKADDGVLGDHEFSLSADGIFERTSVNETLHKWSGVKEVSQTSMLILIELNYGALYIIPKRSFSSSAELSCFWDDLSTYARELA